MTDYSIIMATFTDHHKADKAIEEVFDKHLCASAQAIEAHSHYIWEGQMKKDHEVIVYFVSKKADFDQVANILHRTAMTDYPEIISLDIDQATEKYLSWVEKMTTPRHPRR